LAKHSLEILGELHRYDSFLDSLTTIVDVGCGEGEDTLWWATLTTRDDPPEPYNYKVYAIDHSETQLSRVPNHPNIVKMHADFTKPYVLPSNTDLLWSHDSLQYSINPLETLRNWNEQMTVNGMLVLSIPQHSGVEYNKYFSRTYSGCYHNFTPTSLIYMLAVNGFDCNDAYMRKRFNDPWINIAVYKSEIKPMDPAITSWYDLAETGLLHPSVTSCIARNGYVKQEEMLYPWLDRENYFVDYVSQASDIGVELPPATIEGVFNTSAHSTDHAIADSQANKVVKDPVKLKPGSVGILRPPKRSFNQT
jgi:SAM-dependent methyltransferase